MIRHIKEDRVTADDLTTIQHLRLSLDQDFAMLPTAQQNKLRPLKMRITDHLDKIEQKVALTLRGGHSACPASHCTVAGRAL